jgi:hypothetical protein
MNILQTVSALITFGICVGAGLLFRRIAARYIAEETERAFKAAEKYIG